MTDTITKRERSKNMSKVRSRDTKPEWILRCGLHNLGFRYRLRDRRLPGSPDLVFPKHGAVVFVHGCYWHRHARCKDATTPKTNVAFWKKKFTENVERVRADKRMLKQPGWRVKVVWECQLIKRTEGTIQSVAKWLYSSNRGCSQSKRNRTPLDRRRLLSVAEDRVRYRISSYGRHIPKVRAVRETDTLEPSAVVDLFSGAGGMSYGFHKHPSFEVVAAADAEMGKPSTGEGKLQCNSTYVQNIGIQPRKIDLSSIPADNLRSALDLDAGKHISVLSTCPPCTGFSRTNPNNHLRDDKRNSLVRRSAEFAVALGVDVVVMENARELVRGNFKHHYEWFREHLEHHGYNVFGRTYMLSRFGLPQVRERAIVVAAKQELPLHTLDSLWDGWAIRNAALTVRNTFRAISPKAEGVDCFPSFSSDAVRNRICAVPKNGGSWMDLLRRKDADILLTDAMKRIARLKRFGSYPDVYGRMSWDKPAPTIKRECAHVGNGRYAHPEEDRVCSVRELAALQGFPNEFVFNGAAIFNMYRHIGDAVPPIVSYQVAHLSHWILTNQQPTIEEILLPNTHLSSRDIERTLQQELLYA